MPPIDGTPFNDNLTGTPDADIINGLDGDDVIDGLGGNDIIDGGNGSDTASFASWTQAVFAGLGAAGSGFAANADESEFDELIGIENLTGSAFNDTLSGNNGANILDGGDGHDLLYGRGGDDALLGGNGDDFLRGSDGADILDGGAGWDRVSSFVDVPTTGISFDLNIQGVAQDTGQGMDVLIGIEHASGTVLDDMLTGNGGDNWLWDGGDGNPATVGTGNDILAGGAGNDLLETGGGNDLLSGGDGIDTWSLLGGQSEIGAVGVTASLALQGAAQDTEQGLMTATGFENLSGSIHGDSLTGDSGDNVLAGDLGSDVLLGGAGNDTLYGDGRIYVDSHETGGAGPITTFANAPDLDRDGDGIADFVSGDDVLDGGAGDDIMNGGVGSDTASFASWTVGVQVGLGTGGNGFATNELGTENDTLVSIENVSGSAFNDFINGNNDANVLSGGAGGDALFGRGGDDVMEGGEGNDFLRGSDGADTLNGGSGWDRVSSFVVSPTAGITFNLNIQGVAQNTGQGMDILIGIEHASGTILSDTLIGDDGANWLWGGSDGVGGLGTGDDTISGNGGDDLIEVGSGNHNLSGGSGTDTLSFLGGHVDITAAGVTFSLAAQGAAQATEQGSMTASGFENVSGSLHDDVLTGNGGDNILLGDFGNDALSGGDGNDRLYGDGRLWVDTSDSAGGSGPIALFGEADDGAGVAAGNDTLIGGKGNDMLYGGQGNDVMTGSQGSDSFVIEADSGSDRITDFGNLDRIIFDALSGADDFSDLILTASGSHDTLISWGTGDSILVEGQKPNQLDASDFQFGSPAAASASLASVAESLSLGSGFHAGHDALDQGGLHAALNALQAG